MQKLKKGLAKLQMQSIRVVLLLDIKMLRGWDHDSTETHLAARYEEYIRESLRPLMRKFDKTDMPARLHVIEQAAKFASSTGLNLTASSLRVGLQ